MLKLLKKLQASTDCWFLLGTGVIFFLLRLPSFFEPYWYGDEGIYEVIGFALRHGKLLYRDIWDNKPPLLYLIYALGSGDQMIAKILSAIAGFLAVIVFFFLAKRLFTKKIQIYFSTALFALLFGLPLLEGNIANAENFMLLPIISAALLVVVVLQKKLSFRNQTLFLFSAGLLIGVAFLTKVVAVFDIAAFAFVLAVMKFETLQKSWKTILSHLIPLGIGFVVPLLLTIAYFASQHILPTFFQSAFFSNVGYVNYGNQFIIPQGLLILKLILLAGILCVLFIKRKSFSLTELFVYTWIPFAVFNALFSQRPYTHYVLVTIAAASLLAGLVIVHKRAKPLSSIILLITFLLLVKNFNFYTKPFSYYSNFVSYVVGQKDTTAYQSFFDKGTPRDYAIASFIKSTIKPDQHVFIWTNSAQIYKLLDILPPGRFIVAYHITTNQKTLDETSLALQKEMPDVVVLLPNATGFPFAIRNYRPLFSIQQGVVYEKVF